MSVVKLQKDFEDFQKDVKSRLNTMAFLGEDAFKLVLKEVIRAEQREKLFRDIQMTIIVVGTIVIMSVWFIIFLIFFTEPI